MNMNNDHFHGSSMNKVLMTTFVVHPRIITTKNINERNFIEVGIDDNMPVLYVYKDGDLFDWHFFGGTFEQEMQNLINCYVTVHEHEPSIQIINEFRCWCKALKDKNIIE